MISVVSADKCITYLELLQRRPVDSLEKRRREFSGIPAELIHYVDAIDYVMKLRMLCLKRNKSKVYLFTCFHLNSLLEKMADREENNFADEEKVRNFLLI